jgi:hypothetical protein
LIGFIKAFELNLFDFSSWLNANASCLFIEQLLLSPYFLTYLCFPFSNQPFDETSCVFFIFNTPQMLFNGLLSFGLFVILVNNNPELSVFG